MSKRLLGCVVAGAALTGTLMAGTASAATDTAAPKGFQPSSSSWLTPNVGWVLGYTATNTRRPTLLSTVDSGRHWRSVGAPPLALPDNSNQVKIRFATPLTAVASDGTRVVSTVDGGRHWANVTLPGAPAGAYVGGLAATPTHFYAVTSGHLGAQLFSALPLQHRWTPVRGVSATGDSFGDVNTVGGLTVSIGEDFGVPRLFGSRDGFTFTRRADPCPEAAYPSVGGSSGGRTFVLCTSDAGRGMSVKQLRSAAGTGPFTDAGTTLPDLGISEQAATTTPTTTVVSAIGGGAAFLYRTTDAGRTWTNPLVVDPDRTFTDLAFTGSKVGTVVSGGPSSYAATVFRTTDGGATWKPLTF